MLRPYFSSWNEPCCFLSPSLCSPCLPPPTPDCPLRHVSHLHGKTHLHCLLPETFLPQLEILPISRAPSSEHSPPWIPYLYAHLISDSPGTSCKQPFWSLLFPSSREMSWPVVPPPECFSCGQPFPPPAQCVQPALGPSSSPAQLWVPMPASWILQWSL